MQTSKMSLSQFLIESERQCKIKRGQNPDIGRKICWLLQPRKSNNLSKANK